MSEEERKTILGLVGSNPTPGARQITSTASIILHDMKQIGTELIDSFPFS